MALDFQRARLAKVRLAVAASASYMPGVSAQAIVLVLVAGLRQSFFFWQTGSMDHDRG